jgi:hypothetical protein
VVVAGWVVVAVVGGSVVVLAVLAVDVGRSVVVALVRSVVAGRSEVAGPMVVAVDPALPQAAVDATATQTIAIRHDPGRLLIGERAYALA